MSNSLAIATVTATLRNLIKAGIGNDVPGAVVTTQPLDEVKTPGDLINLFLYQTTIDGAWVNRDMSQQIKPGEPGLALNLFYLLTAYGKNNAAPELPDLTSHRLLGRAMRVLHDHPVLSPAEIKNSLSGNDLHEQIERVRITHQPITLDEMSKLWTTFQAKYRISTAYEVSVVLIDSQRLSTTPLPVLKRGQADQGVDAQANLIAPFPTLNEMRLPLEKQPSAQLGDKLILRGHHLDGASLTARFSNPRLGAPIEIGPLAAAPSTELADIEVTLPNDAGSSAVWVAGYYTVSLVVTRNSSPTNKLRTTNELSFALAPQILSGLPLTRAAATGDFALTLTCSPEVLPEQRASLLFGADEIEAHAHATKTNTLTFQIPIDETSIGEHFVRLRVDGIDSLLVKYDQTPFAFDDDQKVTIT
jgi:hypothetical protein